MWESQGVPEPDLLGNIHSGDLTQGSGVSTVQLQNPNVPLNPTKTINGSIFLQSPLVWAMAIALLIIVKLVAENAGQKSEFSSVRVGLENWFVVGVLAATFIYALKTSAALLPSSANWAMVIRQFAGLT